MLSRGHTNERTAGDENFISSRARSSRSSRERERKRERDRDREKERERRDETREERRTFFNPPHPAEACGRVLPQKKKKKKKKKKEETLLSCTFYVGNPRTE